METTLGLNAFSNDVSHWDQPCRGSWQNNRGKVRGLANCHDRRTCDCKLNTRAANCTPRHPLGSNDSSFKPRRWLILIVRLTITISHNITSRHHKGRSIIKDVILYLRYVDTSNCDIAWNSAQTNESVPWSEPPLCLCLCPNFLRFTRLWKSMSSSEELL